MTFYSVDVEADGPVPGLYSLLSIGLVAVRPGLDDSFYAELRPVTERFVPEALAVSGLDRDELARSGSEPATVLDELRAFVERTTRGRPVLVADNPGFDFAFLNYYCWAFNSDSLERPNPFGHSCRRLGDLWAGMQQDASEASSWKAFRTTEHSHNALDDARGNAEALLEMKRRGLRIGLH